MISKEALDNLYQGSLNPVNCVYATFRTGRSEKITDDYNIIKKDLEVLEQYKDIEEELGIDLITFFKTISQGYIFVREHNTEEKEIVAEDVIPNFLNHTFDFKEPRKEIGKGRPFSRIGKTWALTSEELENDK